MSSKSLVTCYLLGSSEPDALSVIEAYPRTNIAQLKYLVAKKYNLSIKGLLLWKIPYPSSNFEESTSRHAFDPDASLNNHYESFDVLPDDLIVVKASLNDGYDCDDNHTSKRRKLASSEAISPPYINLYKECWGNPLDERFTRLPDAAIRQEDDEPDAEDDEEDNNEPEQEDVILPGDPFLRLASLKMNLLVRVEYIHMFDAVESAHKMDKPLAIITGQPGIGKTYWMYYALRRCLGRKQRVVWFINPAYLLFSDLGVTAIDIWTHTDDDDDYTWCFVDAAACDTLPPLMYNHMTPLFPIYVTAPKQTRWNQLHQARNPVKIIMNPWSLGEIMKGAELYDNLSPEEARERFYKYGPTAGLCLKSKQEDLDEFTSNQRWMLKSIGVRLWELLNNAEMLAMDNFSHTICLVQRLKRDDIFSSHVIKFITPSIADKIREELLSITAEERISLFNFFHHDPKAEGTSGIIFESHCHSMFYKKIKIVAEPMFQTKEGKNRWECPFFDYDGKPLFQEAQKAAVAGNSNLIIHLDIAPNGHHVYGGMKPGEKIAVEEGIYYRPFSGTEAAIDSFIIQNNCLYFFQFILSPKHDIDAKINKLGDKFSGLPSQAHWRFIFVLPAESSSFSCAHNTLRWCIPYAAELDVDEA